MNQFYVCIVNLWWISVLVVALSLMKNIGNGSLNLEMVQIGLLEMVGNTSKCSGDGVANQSWFS